MVLSNHKYFNWFYYPKKKHLLFNLGTALFIWLFLAFTLPFGMYNNNIDSTFFLLIVLLPYGLIWIAVSYLTDFFINPVLGIQMDKKNSLSFWILILKIFFLVNFSFLIRNMLSGWSDFYISEYLELWGGCLLLIFLSYLPYSFYARYKYFQSLIGQDKKDSDNIIELFGDGKSSVKLDPERIVYFKADDNYVDVVCKGHGNDIDTHVVRARLKYIEDQLLPHGRFLRVHRSYIVNMQHVVALDKSRIRIRINDDEKELPVSKMYMDQLTKLLS